ncbi:hypothetical protein E8E14_006676 [Neopestalotiopsis sp. 37M]|nr:hypothetical protein E8E14_006676 [Neopestalotiopsis sp. 37M]
MSEEEKSKILTDVPPWMISGWGAPIGPDRKRRISENRGKVDMHRPPKKVREEKLGYTPRAEPATAPMTFEVEIEFFALCKEVPAFDSSKVNFDMVNVGLPGQEILIPNPQKILRKPDSRFEVTGYKLHRALEPGQPEADLGLEPDKPNYIPIRHGGSAMEGFDDIRRGLGIGKNIKIHQDGPRVVNRRGITPEERYSDRDRPRWAYNTENPWHHKWIVGVNPAAALDEKDAHLATNGVHALPIRLTTPTMTRKNADYHELIRVLVLIKKLWKIHINDSCGINVNVGRARQRFSADELRDAARLCWATEGIMFQIHDPRRSERDAVHMRRWSALGRGMTADNFGYDKKPNFTRREGIALLEGDAELKKCTTEAQVSGLLYYSLKQMSFDFQNYSPAFIQEQQARDYVVEPTIQFRQAGASINGEWIAHWTNICVRSLEWLFEGYNRSRLDDIANGCVQGESGNEDQLAHVLIDYLNMIGCTEQAEYLVLTNREFRAFGGTPTLTPAPDPTVKPTATTAPVAPAASAAPAALAAP